MVLPLMGSLSAVFVAELRGWLLPVLVLIAQVALLIFMIWGPRRRVAFDLKRREIQIKTEGLFSGADGKTIPFTEVRDIVVTKQPFRELKARTAAGDVYLCGLNRTYANDQALRELGTVFSP